jgi:hypothetical protein
VQLAEARARADAGQWAIGWAASRALTTEAAVAEALSALAEAAAAQDGAGPAPIPATQG